MNKINRALLYIDMIAVLTNISTYCYASAEEHLPSDTPLHEQHRSRVEHTQQYRYDVGLNMLEDLSMLETTSSSEDSILIPDNSQSLEDNIPQNPSNNSKPSYLFPHHDSQVNVKLVDEQVFLNQAAGEESYYWNGSSGKQYFITKKKSNRTIGVEQK